VLANVHHVQRFFLMIDFWAHVCKLEDRTRRIDVNNAFRDHRMMGISQGIAVVMPGREQRSEMKTAAGEAR
jgi:hypothetical protein